MCVAGFSKSKSFSLCSVDYCFFLELCKAAFNLLYFIKISVTCLSHGLNLTLRLLLRQEQTYFLQLDRVSSQLPEVLDDMMRFLLDFRLTKTISRFINKDNSSFLSLVLIFMV